MAILRCAREFEPLLSSALALLTTLQQRPLAVHTRHASGTIRACQLALVRHNERVLAARLAAETPSERRRLAQASAAIPVDLS